MAFTRPTLAEIINRVKGDIKDELGVTNLLRRSFLLAFGKALAGVSHMLHGHMFWISRQIFADKAEAEYLERHASIYGLERKAATYGQQSAGATGVNGSVIPAGTLYKRSDDAQYSVDADATIAGGVATVELTALTPGADYNNEVGDTLTPISPVSGVDSTITISAVTVDAEDVETDESFRERLVERIQNPPSGGTAADYIIWAKAVAGVTRAWVFPGHLGAGTVGVSFVEDGETDIIPSPAKVTEVQDYIDTKKPVEADAIVFAPIDQAVDISIAIKPNTVAVRAAVEAELVDLFSREAQVGGAYKQVGETYDGVIKLSKINEAISIAQGEEDHAVSSPVADFDPGTGGIATLGVITWSTLA